MTSYPRMVYFLNGRAVGSGVCGSIQQYDAQCVMMIPSDHYDFLGMSVVGLTKEEIEKEAENA